MKRDQSSFVASAVTAWSQFWFEPVPVYSYAILRILFGALGLASLIGLHDLATHWALDGLIPDDDGGLGLKSLVRSAGLEQLFPPVLYLATMLSLLGMMIGYRSGTTVTLSFLLSVLQVSWNRLPLSGAQPLMTGIIFCLLWADCGSVWSVDAWLARRAGNRTSPGPVPDTRLHRFA